jgi:hypothetical protein
LSFNKITYFIVVIALFGCNDDITFNQGETENRIVVHARAEVGKKLQLELQQSELITEDTLDNPIDGVAIELFVNGLFREGTYSNPSGFALFNYNVQSYDSLRLEISKPSFDDVYTNAVVPNSIGILQFDTTNKRPNVQGLRVSFFDQPTQANYYQISLKGERWFYTLDINTGQRIDSISGFEEIEMQSVNRLFFSDNNIVNNRQNFELLNDKIFNGKNFVLDVDINTFQLAEQFDRSDIKGLELELKNISSDYYDFLTTLSLNRPVYGGPFSISSQVPSNIVGGYGVFAAYSTDKASIILK